MDYMATNADRLAMVAHGNGRACYWRAISLEISPTSLETRRVYIGAECAAMTTRSGRNTRRRWRSPPERATPDVLVARYYCLDAEQRGKQGASVAEMEVNMLKHW